MTLREKYPSLFAEISRANNVANFKADPKVIFKFTNYDIWVLPDEDLGNPSRDELSNLERGILFELDWEMRKHMLVFANGQFVVPLILKACPNIVTGSQKFASFRTYAMNNFRAWKSMHLYRDFYVSLKHSPVLKHLVLTT